MHLLMHQAPRSKARSKRSGKPCQSPAVRGHSVCRMHGAGGGAPIGNRNARRHGAYSADSIDLVGQVRALARTARQMLGALE
jgi:glucans biosynthesis protein